MSGLPETKTLDLEQEGAWLNVWFNQPEIRNPLTEERVSELQLLCYALEESRDIRGVTFRWREKIFCAGADLKAIKTLFQETPSRAKVVEFSELTGALMNSINSLPQITVMAVEGAAIAGGFGLVCLGDVVVADVNAKFALTETRLGLSPAQIAPYVVQRLGFREARRLMLTGAGFNGNIALEMGLVDEVTDGDGEMNLALGSIRNLTMNCAPGAIADTKKLILSLPHLSHQEYTEAAAVNFADRVLSNEGREGVLSFAQRRKPAWSKD